MSRLLTAIVTAFVFFVSLGSTAYAQSALDGSILDLAKPALEAARGGQGFLATALGLVVVVALLRRYGSKRFAWMGSDVGGTALTLAGSFFAAVATAVAAGQGVSFGLVTTALTVAIAASGGYTTIKRMLIPALRALRAKGGVLARPLDLILWIFDRPDAVAKAESAGKAAVAKAPGKGAAGVVGNADEIE